MSAKKAKEMQFGEAMEGLEVILRRIESEEIDIDELAEELKRATQLLELCRTKLRRAEVEVMEVVGKLEEEDAETAAGDE